MKKTLIALAVAAGLVASTANGQAMVKGQVVEFAANAQVVTATKVTPEQPLMNFRAGTAEQPGLTVMSIAKDGTIAFSYGATIDFAGFAGDNLKPVGPVKWVVVYVQGEPMLLPLYNMTQWPQQ